MTRRELQDLVGFAVGEKMRMVAGPDGTVYGRCEDGSWEPYAGPGEFIPLDAIPVTPQEDEAWEERGDV